MNVIRRVRRDLTPESLSVESRSMLEMMSHGESNTDIAVHLGTSGQNVKNAAKVIYDRLGARNRANAVAIAMRLKWFA